MKTTRIFLFCLAAMVLPTGTKAQDNTVYQSPLLKVKQLSPHTWQHITYLQTESFGLVECNGLIVADGGEAVVFDTPSDNTAADSLIAFISQHLNARITAVIPTHFHADCLGGLAAFHRKNIPSFAYKGTVQLARQQETALPQHAFGRQKTFKAGSQRIKVVYAGAGHTADNVVAFVTNDRVLFGGCLVKAMNAGKGYLADADVTAWPATIQKVQHLFGSATVVVPGHGPTGGQELLQFTQQLFSK